jgi:UDP-N-acetylmuramate--alanine ligase
MLDRILNIYFLGIGGIGMSALAHWTHLKKINTQGWDDNIDSPIIDQLIQSGIIVHNNQQDEPFFSDIKNFNNENAIIIYTPAISNHHPIFQHFKTKKYKMYKRADLLEFISKSYKVIAIAGTHGKTTISIMLSHILRCSGINCNAFFGGISNNYNTNFLIGDSEIMVVEADEYDQSFLKLSPMIALISSLDKDHGDVYRNHEAMITAYKKFIKNTQDMIISHYDLNNKSDFTYSMKTLSDFYISNPYVEDNNISFMIHFPDNSTIQTHLLSGSNHNIENAVAAASLAFSLGVGPANIGKALTSFKGVKRRFEYHVNSQNLIMIDDYAHHPQELRALINSVRSLYDKQELFLIFQPHLFSRTQEFEDDFAEVLSLVDKLVLLTIYPAREEPIPGVTSRNLLKKINIKHKWCLDIDNMDLTKHSNLKDILLSENPNLLITSGAGDIYKLIPQIKSILM